MQTIQERYSSDKHFKKLMVYIISQNNNYFITHSEYFKLRNRSLIKLMSQDHNVLINPDVDKSDILSDLFIEDFKILQEIKNEELKTKGIEEYFILTFFSGEAKKNSILYNNKFYTGFEHSLAISFEITLEHNLFYNHDTDKINFLFDPEKSKYQEYAYKNHNTYEDEYNKYKKHFLSNIKNYFLNTIIEKEVSKNNINFILDHYINYTLNHNFASTGELIYQNMTDNKKEDETYLGYFIDNRENYLMSSVNKNNYVDSKYNYFYIYSLKNLVLSCIEKDVDVEIYQFVKERHLDMFIFEIGSNRTFQVETLYFLKCEGDETYISGFSLYRNDTCIKHFDMNKDFIDDFKQFILEDVRVIFKNNSQYESSFTKYMQNDYIKPLKNNLQHYLENFMDKIQLEHESLHSMTLSELNGSFKNIKFYYDNQLLDTVQIMHHETSKIQSLALNLLGKIEKYEIGNILPQQDENISLNKAKRL